MSYWHANISQNGAVGKVALQARYRKFCSENSYNALAKERLPSAFSKSIGFTLCGMADDPTSPAFTSSTK